MTRQCSATSSSEQSETVGQAFEDLFSREDSGSDRGELDRQRKPIEPPAEVDDRGLIRVGQLEGARCRHRTLYEQHHRFVVSQLTERHTSVTWRQLERRDLYHVLPRYLERLAAGCDHPDTRRSAKHLGHERGRRIEQVLAVVQDEQELLVLQVIDQDLQRLHRSLVSKVKGRNRSIGHQGRIPNVGERDQPCACHEAPTQVGSNPYCQSGLAHAARPYETDQSGRCELLFEFRKLTATSYEACCLKG